ncbi:MAG TPA: hypothetical protein VHF22_07975, partial [Planctomycetota bacterium]|nr:hypothetical protein [Planctomycetota bacterium]
MSSPEKTQILQAAQPDAADGAAAAPAPGPVGAQGTQILQAAPADDAAAATPAQGPVGAKGTQILQ